MAEVKEVKNATSKTVVRLVAPEKVSVVGTVVSVTRRKAGGKIAKDCRIVTVETIAINGEASDSIVDVFITDAQWAEKGYDCAKAVYTGNVVNFTLDDCIEGVTGYYENVDDVEMTQHDRNHKAFQRVLEISTNKYSQLLMKQQLPMQYCLSVADSLTKLRTTFAAINVSGGESSSDNGSF